MKTVTQYREDISAMLKASGDLDAKAISESRDFSEAELEMKNELLNRVAALKKTVETMEREENMRASLETPQERKTVENSKKTVIEVGDDLRTKDRFGSFGAQMAAVMKAGLPGGHVDPKLFNATGLNETTPSDGGFLVQKDFASQMIQQVFETGKLAPLCRRITISGNANGTKLNGVDETSRVSGSRYGGIRGYWAAEADEKTASKPKFRQIELNLKKLVGLCYATDEMLDDSAQLEGVIRQGFVSEFGFLLDDAILNGTGAGQPLGVMNSGAKVTVTKVAGQGANTVIGDNVVDMYSRLFAGSRSNAVWLINQAVEPQLMKMVLGKVYGTNTAAVGGLVYMPPGGLSQSPYGTLFGRPVIPVEQCQALGTEGDIILADLTNGYVLAEKGGMSADVSIHVRFIYDESVFRFVLRVDGQPVRATALTPFKGSATQSHFITLNSDRT